jgi:lipopolysaccharide/colanic/teichoic acid biosynthesis glycosyltransferase
MLKRAVDLLIATVGLIVLLPVLVVVAILIKMDSSGPVFFRQARVGINGKGFRIFKFRSMVSGAYKMGSRLTTKRDPRVTRVGQFLRWFKIDELPQLINVLKGDMSLIGPRPEDPYFVRFYTPEQRRVLSLRPGMVGPSQILGRDELESYPEGLKDTERYYIEHILPEKLERDLEYVERASFLGDMSLLTRGIWATARGAVKTKFLWRRRHRVALFGADCLLIAGSCYLAFMIRHDFDWPLNPRFLVLPLLITLATRSMALMYCGAYQGVFAYFGLWDLAAIFKAVSLSGVISAGLTFFVGLQSFPRSVFIIDWAIILFLLGGVRYGLRGWVRSRWRQRGPRRHKALVVGAGVGGEQIARTLLEDPLCPYRPVGFIDEQPERWGSLIHGVRVLGGATELPLAVSANRIQAVFVCMSDLSDAAAQEVVDVCERAGVEYRIVPALSDLLSVQTFGSERAISTGSVAVARQ